MRGFPPAKAGMVIGLLGGSFDPAHAGHVHVTRTALKRFGLDRIWWLVSPGNPLKSRGPAPMHTRLEFARSLMRHPKVKVTNIEAHLGTRYTAETLAKLTIIYPNVKFVWLMGADNLAQLDQWQDWRFIMETVPVGVLARPGDRIAARLSKAARVYSHARISPYHASRLAKGDAPRWAFLNMPMSDMSSSAIRARGGWN